METEEHGQEQPLEKTNVFTQEELDRIIQERLTRDRRSRTATLSDRERELTARENRLACAEILTERGYPKELLQILDTSDAERFLENISQLLDLGLLHAAGTPRAVAATPGIDKTVTDSAFREAFGLAGK